MGKTALQRGRRNRTRHPVTPEVLAREICQTLHQGSAVDLTLMTMTDVLDYADYFIVCHGLSPPHLKALANLIEEKATELGFRPGHVARTRGLRWIVFDLDMVIVHVFSEEARYFYGLERLWSDAPRQVIGKETVDG